MKSVNRKRKKKTQASRVLKGKEGKAQSRCRFTADCHLVQTDHDPCNKKPRTVSRQSSRLFRIFFFKYRTLSREKKKLFCCLRFEYKVKQASLSSTSRPSLWSKWVPYSPSLHERNTQTADTQLAVTKAMYAAAT